MYQTPTRAAPGSPASIARAMSQDSGESGTGCESFPGAGTSD